MSFETTTEQKLEELASENRSLKRLLLVRGMRNNVLDTYSSAVRVAPDISWPPLGDDHAVSKDFSASNPSLDRLEVCRSYIICTLLDT